MGQWGYNSYDGDDVYDFLDEFTAKGSHASSTTILNNVWRDADYDQAKLGVVIFILSAQKEGFQEDSSIVLHVRGYQVPMSKLKAAREIAIHLLEDLTDWDDEDKRRRALVAELVMLQNEIDGRTQ
jgi:hypothetical protein